MFSLRSIYKYAHNGVKRAIIRAQRIAKSITREYEAVPKRGFCNKFSTKKAVEEYERIFSLLESSIRSSNLPADVKEDLIEFETFQKSQKGPVGPVSDKAWDSNVIEPLIDISKSKAPALSDEIKKCITELFNYFSFSSVKADATKINFHEIWNNLPSKTLRGFPYAEKGANVDEQFLKEVGSTYKEALAYFNTLSFNPCLTGLRLQGTPGNEEGKVRVVIIPSLYYQYINYALFHGVMDYLKKFPNFNGWNKPEIRESMINNAINKASSEGYTLIGLDFSKFDRHCSNEFRNLVDESLKLFYSATPDIDKWYEQHKNLNNNQFVCISQQSKPAHWIRAPFLISGVINTQYTGSLINLSLQAVFAKELGFDHKFSYSFALGDDVAFPVPSEMVADKQSYLKTLSRIAEIADKYHFKTHDKKAYPSSNLVFLQRLYSKNVRGIGSYARTIASFMFKEKYTKTKIEGVKSIAALELLAQVTMISDIEKYSNVSLDEFRALFCDWWLDNDDGLYSICALLYDKGKLTAFNVIAVIVDLSTKDIDVIKTYFDANSYDRFGLDSIFNPEEFNKNFNIVNNIIKQFKPLRKVDSYEKIFKTSLTNLSYDNAIDEYLIESTEY